AQAAIDHLRAYVLSPDGLDLSRTNHTQEDTMTTSVLTGENAGRSPLPNSKRTVYYDHGGDPFYTEWALLTEPAVQDKARAILPLKRVAAVAGIRPGGIGDAVARRFLRSGYRLFCCDRDEAAGRAAAAALPQEDGDVHFIPADVSTDQGVADFLKFIADKSL